MSDEEITVDFKEEDEKIPRTILVVEDETPDFIIAEKQIKKLWPSAEIVNVKSLRDAQRAISQEDFDMVLLDLNLPDGLGPTSVESVRQVDKSVPIIVVTGFATNFTVDEALKLGANNVVPKSNITDSDFFNILEQNEDE